MQVNNNNPIKAESTLAKVDDTFDKIPLASTITNLCDLCLKTFVNNKDSKSLSPYWKHIKEKGVGRMVALLVPVFGQIGVAIYDSVREKTWRNKEFVKAKVEEHPSNILNISKTLLRDHAFMNELLCGHPLAAVLLVDQHPDEVFDAFSANTEYLYDKQVEHDNNFFNTLIKQYEVQHPRNEEMHFRREQTDEAIIDLSGGVFAYPTPEEADKIDEENKKSAVRNQILGHSPKNDNADEIY